MKLYTPPSLRPYPPRAGSVCLAIERYIVKNGYAPTKDMACFVGHMLLSELRSFVDAGLLKFRGNDYGGTETFVELTESGAACAALEAERCRG